MQLIVPTNPLLHSWSLMVAVTRLEGFGVLVNGGAAFCAFVSICIFAPLDVPASKYRTKMIVIDRMVFYCWCNLPSLRSNSPLLRSKKLETQFRDNSCSNKSTKLVNFLVGFWGPRPIWVSVGPRPFLDPSGPKKIENGH